MIKGSKLTLEGYSIPKNKLTDKQLQLIEKELTVVPLNSDYVKEGDSSTKYKIYKIDEENVIIPRYYGLKKFGQPESDNFEPKKVNIKFTSELRDYQKDITDKCLVHIKKHGGGLLVVPCGSGKTVMAIYMASQLGLKTLIITHKTFLQDQWIDRCKQFTKSKVGIIRQDTVDVEGKHFVVAMVQSLSRREYDPEIFKDFGICIVDECFAGKEYVQTDTDIGKSSIAQLYELWKNNKKLPLIKSYNEKIGCFEFKKMTYAWKKNVNKMTEVSIGKYKILCTPNHKFLTSRGYIEAKKLQGNVLFGINNIGKHNNVFAPKLNDDQFQIVLGSFLGDRHIVMTNKKTSRYCLKIQHEEDQIEYCKWKAQMFGQNIRRIEKNGYTQKPAVSFCTKIFDLEENLPDKKTLCPQWIIDKIDFRAIAIWVMDDCSINKKSPMITLSTCSFDEDSHNRLIKKLQKMGISSKMITSDGYNYIQLSEEGTKLLTSKIYKYVHPSMIYNSYSPCGENKDKKDVRTYSFNPNCSKYVWNTTFENVSTYKVLTVTNINKNIDVYDIEVEDNHNFIVGPSSKSTKHGAIVHNCHHFSAKYFSKALMKTGAKYTIGLSATPRRSDGLFKVVKWLLGDIMFEKKLQTNNQVVAKIITYHSKDKLFKEKKRFINGKVRPDCVKMITNLITLDSRNQHIINVIDQLRKDPERKILILSGRKNHLTHLKTSVDKLIQNDVDAEIILSDECKTYYYTGDIKRDERTEAEKEADILFGTYDMAHEGLDIDRLNTIILTTPKKDVEQAVGRILRKILQNGDIRPLVVDFVDNLPIFARQGETRETFYKKSKYVQQYYYAFEEDLVSPRKYLKIIGQENDDVSKKTPESYEEILSVPPVEIIDECSDENSDKPKKSSSKTKTYKDLLDVRMF